MVLTLQLTPLIAAALQTAAEANQRSVEEQAAHWLRLGRSLGDRALHRWLEARAADQEGRRGGQRGRWHGG